MNPCPRDGIPLAPCDPSCTRRCARSRRALDALLRSPVGHRGGGRPLRDEPRIVDDVAAICRERVETILWSPSRGG